MSGTLTFSEFLQEATELVTISAKFNDPWILTKVISPEENSYLVYKQKLLVNFQQSTNNLSNENYDEITDPIGLVQNTEELINLEYHVIYSISYQVPILYFNGYRNNGTQISLEDSWQIFKDYNNENIKKSDMLSILTQMDHPILFRPFLSLHPCRTAEILLNTENSKNRIVTFLSVIGPYVRLKLKPEIGMYFKD